MIETTQGNLKFTVAVVGVILNLALFFAYHVLWPQGLAGPFDVVSPLIALGAALAMFRFKMGVIQLLGICAVIGAISTCLFPHGLALAI